GVEEGPKYRYPPGVQAIKTDIPSSQSDDAIELLRQPSRDADSSRNAPLMEAVPGDDIMESSTEYSPIARLPSLPATEDARTSSMSHHMKT
ncbi:MAG: hypothetical protein Q9191_008548, partial [Dirinaria sp. TL-2023a]